MKILSFCINGKMAHFRKYYSNSTALSYLIPPVTTLKGILAGLLGYERDSYYDIFSNVHCRTAILIKRPLKKMTQSMNLLKVESLNDLNGAGKNHTQNDTEFIIPKSIREDYLSYQILFSHDDTLLMKGLADCLTAGTDYYRSKAIALALGSSACGGWIDQVQTVELEARVSRGEELDFYSAVVLNKVEKIGLGSLDNAFLAKEESITEFDAQRQITKASKQDILVNTMQLPLVLSLKKASEYFVFENQNIVFME